MLSVPRLRVATMLAVLVVMSVGVTAAQKANSQAVVFTENDNGKSVAVAVGQKFVIELPANPTTGYSWEVQAVPAAIAKGSQEYQSGGSNLPGAGGTQRLTFHAKETGSGTVTLNYRRPWENGPPAKTFTLTVKVIPSDKK